MYGLLLEAICNHLKNTYGQKVWEDIARKANVDTLVFASHNVYNEELISRIAAAAASLCDDKVGTIMEGFGVAFVSYVGQYGYDKILKVLGRNMRDFLNGLDNLHEYLRFSYPKMRPPSFFVENETKAGLTLHYRSRRRGFVQYVKGQIKRVGELFYNTNVEIFVLEEVDHPEDDTLRVKFRLLFDNKAFRDAQVTIADSVVNDIPLRSEMLFELFPFHILFNCEMKIISTGSAVNAVFPNIVGKNLDDMFYLARPITKLTYHDVLAHTNNVFELVSKQQIKPDNRIKEGANILTTDTLKALEDYENRLHVKGQMLFMSEWESIIFLGTPVMTSLDDMFNSGLYINDLCMHDSSRDMLLAGPQQSVELKLALDKELEKSRLLENSMKMLDDEMKRTDALLYQMIPKPVADRLRSGEPSVDTCQAFENVTILFSDVVGFTSICSRITPMEVVSMLNAMYVEFDQLSEKHNVYKVETIGDAYMAVSGAPTVTEYHALSMCNMAMDMLIAMHKLKDPSTMENMQIRIGIHSGATVAGVVGLKMPRYCLFGDTVNTASRMESNGEAMKIHISEVTRSQLKGYPYLVMERGTVVVKGKGAMKTYWLVGRDESILPTCPMLDIVLKEREQRDHLANADTSELERSRPTYSPVSFDDVNSSGKCTPIPVSSPDKLQTSQQLRLQVEVIVNGLRQTKVIQPITANLDLMNTGYKNQKDNGKPSDEIKLSDEHSKNLSTCNFNKCERNRHNNGVPRRHQPLINLAQHKQGLQASVKENV